MYPWLIILLCFLAAVCPQSHSLKVGVFGAGRVAQAHGRNIVSNPRADIAWVVEPQQELGEKFSRDFHCPVFKSWQEAVTNSIRADCYLIASATASHAPLIEALASLQQPIFCEKPIDVSTARIQEIIRAMQEKDVKLLHGFNRRFDPSLARLKQRIASGEIGKIECLALYSYDHPLNKLDYLKTSGGIFHDFAVHDLDLAQWLLGEDNPVISVFATGSTFKVPELSSLSPPLNVDSTTTILKTKSGALAEISNGLYSPYGYETRIEVQGSLGMLRCESAKPTSVELHNAEGVTRDKLVRDFMERYSESFKLELDHFFDVVETDQKPIASAMDGLSANLIADACAESLQTGRRVKVKELTSEFPVGS